MKIKKIEEVGILPVYNTNVEGNLNFVDENGVIHKNCVVDEDYQGEVHINVINTGIIPQRISPGEKLIQFILLPVFYDDIEEVEIEHLYEEITERASGAFGSTGTI